MVVNTYGQSNRPPALQLRPLPVTIQQTRRQADALGFAAEQKYGLFAKKIPEPPRCIEPQRRTPGVQRDRLFHRDTDFRAEQAEILDGAMMDIGCVVPAERQNVSARHMAGKQKLKPHLPVTKIRE